MHVIRNGGEYLHSKESRAWGALSLVGGALCFGTLLEVFVAAHSNVALPVAVGAIIGMALFAMALLRMITRRLRRIRKGRLGERLTTELVQRLSDDYYLINDITYQYGNVDHVLIGPCGVVVIETKRVAGEIRCDGDHWTVNGHAVRSYSKQVKAAALEVRSLLRSISPDLARDYVEAVVVLNDPHCRVTVNRAQVAVVRFSELLGLIAVLSQKRRMPTATVRRIAHAFPGTRPTKYVMAAQR